MKNYLLKPNLMFPTVTPRPAPHKADPALDKLVNAIVAPAPAGTAAPARTLPPRQPLPTATMDPAKPMLKLGLDVHLESIMAVAQKDHANPQAPRKFTRADLSARR